jgi:hypothetical protein
MISKGLYNNSDDYRYDFHRLPDLNPTHRFRRSSQKSGSKDRVLGPSKLFDKKRRWLGIYRVCPHFSKAARNDVEHSF